MPPVRVVEVEDREEGVRRFLGEAFRADVDPVVRVGGENVPAANVKGSSTTSL